MSGKADRKAAIAAYKERKTPAGVYAIRCAATDQIWVGETPNLEAAENRNWFMLRMGNHHIRDLQEAWNTQGGAGFTYEVLEELDDDVPDVARRRVLGERQAHWLSELNALPA
jgi:hypothetical protein